MKILIALIMSLTSTVVLSQMTPNDELHAQVAETHVFNIPVTLDVESLDCNNLGDLNCVYGVCTAQGSYDNQSATGTSIFAINVSLIDETCNGNKMTVIELAAWDKK